MACCKTSKHDADHGETDECGDGAGITFKIASQPAIAADPGEGPFDNPSLRQDFEASSSGSLDDLQSPYSGACDHASHLLTSVAAVGEDKLDEREQSSRSAQQVESTIPVLNIGGMNNNVQQETQRVDQDVPLATLDLLARVVARRIKRRPPF